MNAKSWTRNSCSAVRLAFMDLEHPSKEGGPYRMLSDIQFQGMARALSNQQSASSYQPTIVRLSRCCLLLLNLVGSCVHAVPILWGNNRTLVLILSRGRCRGVRFTAEDTERRQKTRDGSTREPRGKGIAECKYQGVKCDGNGSPTKTRISSSGSVLCYNDGELI